jgi:hypothetical protein
MLDNIGPTLITVVGGIVGLAIVAVIVSKKAQTPDVVKAGGSALSSIIAAAVAPVSNSGGPSFGSVGSGN